MVLRVARIPGLLLLALLGAGTVGCDQDFSALDPTAALPATGGTCCATATVGAIALPDDHADAPAQATKLTLEQAMPGHLESAGDRDLFQVDLHGGERYELSVSSYGDAYLRVMAADGTELLAGPGREGLRFDAPSSGTFTLQVEPRAGSLDYALLVCRLQP